MADNPQVRAGTAGGTIVVAADEVTIYGSAAQIQGMKIHDGLEGGTVGARVTSSGELVVNQQNNGTVSVTGTPNVHVTNAATVAVTGTPNVHVTNSGTVIQGTDPWRTHQTNNGTVTVSAISGTVPTLEQGGTVIAHVSNSGTVIQGTNPWIVTANSGTILGQRGTVTALQGTDPWLVSGTVSVTGTPNVHITNSATVSVSSIAAGDNNIGNVDIISGGTILGALGTVNVTGTPNVHITNAATVNQGGAPWTVTANGGTILGQAGTVTVLQGTNPWLSSTWLNSAATVSVSTGGTLLGALGTVNVTGTPNVHVTNSATVSVSNLGKAEDALHASGDTGIMALAVRNDAGTAFATDGDYVPLSVDSAGAVRVTGGGGGTQYTEGDTDATITGTAALAEGPGDALTPLQVDASKHLQVDIAADSVGIGGGVQYIEDTAHSTGGTGVMSLAVRKDVAAALADADGDYIPFIADSSGALWAHVNDGTVAVKGNIHVGNNGTVIQGTSPWIVTANGGTILGQAGTVTALQGTDPWVISGTVSTGGAGTQLVHVTNSATVSVSALPGGITGFAEDAGHTTGDVGIQSLAVRKNEPAALAGSDADYTPLTSDSVGAAWVHANDGTVALKGNVWVGNNGTVSVTGTPNVHVTNSGTIAALPGGITGFAEDAGHTTGDVGIQALAVRKNEAAALAGADADYTPLISDSVGAAWVHANDGTVAIKGNVLVGNNGTVTLTGTNPVFVTNNGTVNGGTILGHMGTVHANIANNGTVTLTGTNPVFVTNSGTVSVSALPGGITGFAEDAGHTTGDVGIQALAVRKNEPAALAGADADYTPLTSDSVGAAWVHANDGTVAIKGNVLVGNNGTVSVTGTPNVHVTNSSTVIQGTNPWLVNAWLLSAATATLTGTNPVFVTNNGTVSITGTPNIHVTNAATVTATDLDIRNLAITQDSITVGSATIGLGYTLGGTNILLTGSGTVVPSVSSRVLYVTHEALTCQGGTITITARNGNGGGTLWGPMQFSPTGGMAVSAGIGDGGLYETASGSAVYYELAGSGTVGGRIRWARLAS